MEELNYLPFILLGAAVLLLAIFFYLCAVPAMDLGQSIGCKHLADTAVFDAYP